MSGNSGRLAEERTCCVMRVTCERNPDMYDERHSRLPNLEPIIE